MVKNEKMQIENDLNELVDLCNEIKCIHESLLQLLPSDEKEKHVIWFKAKMLSNWKMHFLLKMRWNAEI